MSSPPSPTRRNRAPPAPRCDAKVRGEFLPRLVRAAMSRPRGVRAIRDVKTARRFHLRRKISRRGDREKRIRDCRATTCATASAPRASALTDSARARISARFSAVAVAGLVRQIQFRPNSIPTIQSPNRPISTVGSGIAGMGLFPKSRRSRANHRGKAGGRRGWFSSQFIHQRMSPILLPSTKRNCIAVLAGTKGLD